jgi:hypothetical protein
MHYENISRMDAPPSLQIRKVTTLSGRGLGLSGPVNACFPQCFPRNSIKIIQNFSAADAGKAYQDFTFDRFQSHPACRDQNSAQPSIQKSSIL